MTRDENYWRTIEFRDPEWIHCGVGLLPATWRKYRGDLEALVLRHPFVFPGFKAGSVGYDHTATPSYRAGSWTDPWGCVWENVAEGMEGMPSTHPLRDRARARDLVLPPPGAGLPHGFMFMRLYYLRSFEELMVDFAEEAPELQILVDTVYAYNRRELESALAREPRPRLMYFGDDLGMQDRFPVSPNAFRRILIPCYARLYGRCHELGVKVYMHSDGRIVDVIPDLIAAGVDVINPQFRANTLPDLVRTCRGKVCVNLDLDRQLFPFCKPADIGGHIVEAIDALNTAHGGLMLSAECAPDVPLDTIEAICCAFEEHRHRFPGR